MLQTNEIAIPSLEEFVPEGYIPSGSPTAGIYLLMAGDQVRYVGQSGDLRKRLAQHRAEKTKSFDSALVYFLDNQMSRLRVEGCLILQWLPIYNHAILLGIDGLAGKIWERDHKNIWVSKRKPGQKRLNVRKAPGRLRAAFGESGGVEP